MSDQDHTSPAKVLARLAEIEQDLATRQNDWETSAGAKARLTRDWEKRLAIHQKVTKGANAETRKAQALSSAIEQDDLYDRLTAAEGTFEAIKTVVKVLEIRTGIGQSILKAQGRS